MNEEATQLAAAHLSLENNTVKVHYTHTAIQQKAVCETVFFICISSYVILTSFYSCQCDSTTC